MTLGKNLISISIEGGWTVADGFWRSKPRWFCVASTAVLVPLWLGAFGPGAMAQSEGDVTFSVEAAKLAMAASNPLAAGKGPKAVVSVTLTGSLYDPPREIRPAAKDAIDRTHISGALASDYGANLAADLDWMAAGFIPEEREELKTYFTSDCGLLEQTQAATRRIEQLFLKGSVRHRGYRLALVVRDHGRRTFRRVYAFSPGTKGWLRTNALTADAVFDVVFSAYLWGKITAAGKSGP